MKSSISVITGGAGFIGSNLAHRLLQHGHRVIVLDNFSRPHVEHNITWLCREHGARVQVEMGDVCNASSVQKVVRGCHHIFHFAAQVAVTASLDDPRGDFDVNAGGTLNVLEAARHQPTPPSVVFTSTNKVYGALSSLHLHRSNRHYQPASHHTRLHGINETQPLDFHSPYGCSKGTADQYVLDYARIYHMPTTVFRMSCIYGPRQFGNEEQGWVAHFMLRALHGQPITIFGDGRQVRDILYIDDLIAAFMHTIEHPTRHAGKVYNIGGGPSNAISLLNLVAVLESLHPHPIALTFAPARLGDQRYFVADCRRFTKATGWQPSVAIHDGLQRLYAWLQCISDVAPRQRIRGELANNP